MGGFSLYFTVAAMGGWEWLAWLLSAVLETVWQVIHAFVPLSSNAYLGGDGFNYINLAYAYIGAAIGLLLDLAIPPHFKPLKNPEGPCSAFDPVADEDAFYDCLDLFGIELEEEIPVEDW